MFRLSSVIYPSFDLGQNRLRNETVPWDVVGDEIVVGVGLGERGSDVCGGTASKYNTRWLVKNVRTLALNYKTITLK